MTHEHVDEYDRETAEYIFPRVTVDGVAVTANVDLSIVPDDGADHHPYQWAAAEVVSGKVAYFVEDMDPGTYRVKARVTDAPEVPVMDCGVFRIV